MAGYNTWYLLRDNFGNGIVSVFVRACVDQQLWTLCSWECTFLYANLVQSLSILLDIAMISYFCFKVSYILHVWLNGCTKIHSTVNWLI